MAREKRITVYILKPTDRPYYKLEWVEPGTERRRSESTKTTDKKTAEQLRKDKEYQLNHGLHEERSTLSWERFREMFLEEYAAGQRRSSQDKYETVFDTFEDVAKPARLADIDERMLSKFHKGMRERKNRGGKIGLAPFTRHNYLVALKTALQWAKGQKLITTVPTFPDVDVPRKKPQPVPQADFDKLLAVAPDPAWRAYMLCGWLAGLRLSEVHHLHRDRSDAYPWLDLPGNRIVFPAEFVKAKVDQWVPIHPDLLTALLAVPIDGPRVFNFKTHYQGTELSAEVAGVRVISMAKKAGVKLSMHRLRKGFGCKVAAKLGKGNAPILHSLMRHSSMQVTMDFYASVDDVLQDAIKLL